MQIIDECTVCKKYSELSLWKKLIYLCPDCYDKILELAEHQGRGWTNKKIIEKLWALNNTLTGT